MAGCVARTVSETPDHRQLDAGETIRGKTFLPTGGLFLPLRSRLSASSDEVPSAAGETRRTIQAGPTRRGNYPRRPSECDQLRIEAGETRRTSIIPFAQSAGTPVIRPRQVVTDVGFPLAYVGETRRTPVPGSGQVNVPLARRRPAYHDDQVLPSGETVRRPGMATGLNDRPLHQTRRETVPDAPAALAAGETRRTALAGQGLTFGPITPRGRVSEAPAAMPGHLAAGETVRRGGPQLSNQGQVVTGPYWTDAVQLYQAGAVQGTILSEG